MIDSVDIVEAGHKACEPLQRMVEEIGTHLEEHGTPREVTTLILYFALRHLVRSVEGGRRFSELPPIELSEIRPTGVRSKKVAPSEWISKLIEECYGQSLHG